MNKQTASIKRQLVDFDHICSGTLLRRHLACGKANCRCKARPPVLHGPYFYWSRRLDGRLVSRVLSVSQAEIVRQAIRNYRKALQLLRKWEAQTVQILEDEKTVGKS